MFWSCIYFTEANHKMWVLNKSLPCHRTCWRATDWLHKPPLVNGSPCLVPKIKYTKFYCNFLSMLLLKASLISLPGERRCLLTPKQQSTFFSNVILFSTANFVMKLFRYNEYIISTVVTDALGLQHQGISSHSADYTPMRCQSFMGYGGLCTVKLLDIYFASLFRICDSIHVLSCFMMRPSRLY